MGASPDAGPPLSFNRNVVKLLVVDDSLTMRRIVVNTLQKLGYHDIVEAADGVEALSRLDESVQLILTDWIMPEMSGLELVRAVRANPRFATLPICMITTRSAREDLIAAIEAGIDDYILKPLQPHTLKEKIERLGKKSRV
jgi:two-component system chemotaxis response regulator CheY